MRRFVLIGFLLFALQAVAFAEGSLQKDMESWVKGLQPIYEQVGKVFLAGVKVLPKASKVEVSLNGSASYFLYRDDFVKRLYREADSIVRCYYPSYGTVIYAGKKEIKTFVPNCYRERKAVDESRLASGRVLVPVVKNVSAPYAVDEGLYGRNIALWSSHGLYYDQREDRWKWQRSRLFGTVEDKLTLDYVLNYLAPMLENAGANVFLPHERDVQTEEVVVDNDVMSATSLYEEENTQWENSAVAGWGGGVKRYVDWENPFEMGTCRKAMSRREPTTSVKWVPSLPKSGDYAVYVSYQSSPNGVNDAHYTVFHAGGKSEFLVNQRQGGGTWIYLGTFRFRENADMSECAVVLTNESAEEDRVVTADAVRFGGGMGNIGRRPASVAEVENYNSSYNKKVEIPMNSGKLEYCTSEFPRYLEASRYWLQWAGFPRHVYSRTVGIDDYLDDVASRGLWVNYLNNGSGHVADSVGLNIPIDLALGLHTDAGIKGGDSIVGSLGICLTKEKLDKFPGGQSRMASRDFSDMVLSELSRVIRGQYNPNWTIRGVWDKSYIEARLPQVPTMLLELLSHQNIADMRCAMDPKFQFAAARAIYKAMARFIASENSQKCTIVPLPVRDFSIRFAGADSVRLTWRATRDTLEADGAMPTSYVVYTRVADGGFDNGVVVVDTMVNMYVRHGVKYDYMVVAVNGGGRSFPSEILSACNTSGKERVLIVNGFTKVSSPRLNEERTGFLNQERIPYGKSVAYTGEQYDFGRDSQWQSNDAPGWGASSSCYEKMVVAGNTFDYPSLHGVAISNAGYSYVSCSLSAIEQGDVDLQSYDAVDLILGGQSSTIGVDSTQVLYKVFPDYLRGALETYMDKGGRLFVSGANIASDGASGADKDFLKKYLKIQLLTRFPSDGQVEYSYSSLCAKKGEFAFVTQPNEEFYYTPISEALSPQEGAIPLLRNKGVGTCAAVAYAGKGRVVTMGFPFEGIENEVERNSLASLVFNFLMNKE